MSFIKEENIGKISFFASVILVLFLTAILGGVFIHEKYKHFDKELERVESIYIALQEERLQSEIDIEIDRINAQRKNADAVFNQKLQNQVNQAHMLVSNLYLKYSLQQRGSKVKELIKSRIRPIWLNNDKDSLFIWSANDGKVILQPKEEIREGDNIFSRIQSLNPSFQKQLKKIQKGSKEGYVRYKWQTKDEDGGIIQASVRAYLSYFEPLNWIIGSNAHIDNFENQLQQRIIGDYNKVKDSDNKESVYLYELHDINGGEKFASVLVNPKRPELVGSNISDTSKDARGNRFRSKMLEGIRSKREALITYWYEKPGNDGTHAKLSFFKLYPEWNWIIEKGTSLDDLDRRVNEMKNELEKDIGNTVRFMAIALAITCVIFLALAYLFSTGIGFLFEGYKKLQKEHQSKLEHLNAILEIQATTDPLTKIYNRAYFNTRIGQEIDRAHRYKTRLSLILFDIDHFKGINDTFGHLSGDDVLKEISSLCQKNIRSSDLLARWGGEEFVILIPEPKKDAAMLLAEKLRFIIEDNTFKIDRQVTCSFGVADYDGEEKKDVFISRADNALYSAKETGRNKVVPA